VNGAEREYLGNTNDPNATSLVWKSGNVRILGKHRKGPEIGNSYSFFVFFVRPPSSVPRAYGPFLNAGPITLAESEVKPVIVTDSIDTSVDISGEIDVDEAGEESLVILWIDPGFTGISDVHVYVSINGEDRVYLGNTNNPNADHLEWIAGNRRIAPNLRGGPTPGNSYKFYVYFIKPGSTPPFEGPIDNGEPVSLMNPTP
jgi:hypothetical protein